MASKSLYWFKSYGDFAEWVDLPTGVVASGRVCPAACAAGLYYDRFPLPLNIGVATGQFGTSEEYTMTFRAGPTVSEPPTREY